MTPTRAFQIANDFIGWGDPKPGGLLFIGIEGAAPYKDIDKLLASEGVRQVDETEFNWKELRQRSAGIRDFTSKIAAGVSDRFHPNDWRTYRNTLLWAKGGGVFQTNLYPLGKPSIKAWEKTYENDFGIGRSEQMAYQNLVREKRFPMLSDFRQTWHPQATICFGNSYTDDFKLMLHLNNSESHFIADYRKKGLEVFDKECVIIAPFFGNGQMSGELAESVVRKLKEWKVVLNHTISERK